MTTVLLTGFEPFAADPTNPSGEAVRLVGTGWDGPSRLVTEVLPVTFSGAADRLGQLVELHHPDVVIATGLAGGRDAVTPERVAINLQDARIPDNSGAQPVDVPCVPGGPTALFSSLPVKAIARDVAAGGIPSRVSLSAGSYVCNHVFYVAAHLAATRPGMRAGFIHVPWDTAHAPEGRPALPLSDIAAALHVAIATTLATPADISIPAGSIH
ncbi:pyroglutamyl-peptidase I [Microbacterium aquimaris]|uniref:Pyroglutamyl-peptidase I n=1 Tax=Microbacterium aquimaris TaxID=459816 RepID=A0ABU5N6K9_9MICO|nr:pyroglutamyl-peptidase I [Microbacterium aquimaris]MDZ8161676.1 pyroglutamyl-peptidase I [Microbacterium aquimaris]